MIMIITIITIITIIIIIIISSSSSSSSRVLVCEPLAQRAAADQPSAPRLTGWEIGGRLLK